MKRIFWFVMILMGQIILWSLRIVLFPLTFVLCCLLFITGAFGETIGWWQEDWPAPVFPDLLFVGICAVARGMRKGVNNVWVRAGQMATEKTDLPERETLLRASKEKVG